MWYNGLLMNSSNKLVNYDNVEQQYLEKRQLKPSAGWILLWAMGVGAVISGDFFGWNLGLAKSGFGGLLVATGIMAVMYFCMVFTVAELSTALPHAGGFFSFTRNAFGPIGGFICGLTDVIEYVITPAVIVIGIGEYMNVLVFGEGSNPPITVTILWWALAYGLFVLINIIGVSLSLRMGLVFAGLAACVLLVFYGGVWFNGSFDSTRLFDIAADPGNGPWFPKGLQGIFVALPFAMWFYLAIEQLPLAAEESHDAAGDMPRALILGMVTLFIFSVLTLTLNTGVVGANDLATDEAPLASGFIKVFGVGDAARVLTLIALVGLIASFHAIVYAYGRVLFALSRAGYIPRFLSLTGKRRTPYVALIAGALIGFVCALVITLTKLGTDSNSHVGSALLNMAVFGAVISYACVMASFIKLRISNPHLARPYRSPLGIPGAVVGLLLSVVALIATLSDPLLLPAVVGVIIFLLLGMIYFFCYSRHHLVAQAPEEEVALIAEAEHELA
jgi:ethanolamine permease